MKFTTKWISDGAVTADKLNSDVSTTFVRADGTTTVTADLAMNSHKITGLAAGENPGDAVNKNQLDSAISGLSWRAPADEAALTPPGSPSEGYRVLINGTGTGDFAGHDNAIATYSGSSWSFETPSANWALFVKADEMGFTYDLDTTTWVQFTGAGQINAGDGLTKSGNTLSALADATGGANLAKSVNVSANGLAVKVDGATIGGNVSDQLEVIDGSIDATKLDQTDSYDFSASGEVRVATQTQADNSTKAASTAYVDTAVGAVTGAVKFVETLTYTDTTNKVLGPLVHTPTSVSNVELTPYGGPDQEYSVDFTVRSVTGGSADGYYVCLATASTAPGGGAFSGGANPSTGIDDILTSGDKCKASYTY